MLAISACTAGAFLFVSKSFTCPLLRAEILPP